MINCSQKLMDKQIKNIMKLNNIDKLNSLINDLNNLKKSWDLNPNNQHVLDANWVGVTLSKSAWRLAKAVGAKKDGYYGWILWSGSTNDSGTNYMEEVKKICKDSKINVLLREYQL
tara:strand:+ start:329 stop:676 length:348 start_codon:yes stop_codon:yes gene_type:complete